MKPQARGVFRRRELPSGRVLGFKVCLGCGEWTPPKVVGDEVTGRVRCRLCGHEGDLKALSLMKAARDLKLRGLELRGEAFKVMIEYRQAINRSIHWPEWKRRRLFRKIRPNQDMVY